MEQWGQPVRLKDIKGLGTAVVVLLAIQIALVLPQAVTLLHRISLLNKYQSGDFSVAASLSSADSSVEGFAGLASLVFIATVVVWLIWQHHAQYNARQFAAGLTYTPGWAVGWWFIPFANLVKPFQTMRELWKASHGGRWQEIRTWPVLGFWWATYLASNISVWVGSSAAGIAFGTTSTPRTATTGDVIAHDKWALVSLVLRTAAAVLAIMLVRAITTMQQNAELTPVPPAPFADGAALPPPPPPPV